MLFFNTLFIIRSVLFQEKQAKGGPMNIITQIWTNGWRSGNMNLTLVCHSFCSDWGEIHITKTQPFYSEQFSGVFSIVLAKKFVWVTEKPTQYITILCNYHFHLQKPLAFLKVTTIPLLPYLVTISTPKYLKIGYHTRP